MEEPISYVKPRSYYKGRVTDERRVMSRPRDTTKARVWKAILTATQVY